MPVRGWVLSGRRLRFCRRRFDETTARTRPEDRMSDAGNAATEGCFAGKPGKGQKASRPTCQAKIAEPEESPIHDSRLPNRDEYYFEPSIRIGKICARTRPKSRKIAEPEESPVSEAGGRAAAL